MNEPFNGCFYRNFQAVIVCLARVAWRGGRGGAAATGRRRRHAQMSTAGVCFPKHEAEVAFGKLCFHYGFFVASMEPGACCPREIPRVWACPVAGVKEHKEEFASGGGQWLTRVSRERMVIYNFCLATACSCVPPPSHVTLSVSLRVYTDAVTFQHMTGYGWLWMWMDGSQEEGVKEG